MNRAYKFRIYPTREQEILIHKTFGCCRFVYNHMLADKKQAYEETKKTIKITPAAYKKEYPWLKEVDSLALANEQLHLERAYRKFFEESKIEFPKFKPKHGSRKSYTTNVVNGNIRISEGKLRLGSTSETRNGRIYCAVYGNPPVFQHTLSSTSHHISARTALRAK